jgi:hypothetical protein
MKILLDHILIILFVLISMVSCRSPQILTETITRDSTIIREIPRIITIPAESAKSPSINLDSLVRLIQSGVKTEVINRTLIQTDPQTNLRVGLILDELGNLSALCESQERTIELLEKEIERFRFQSTQTTIIEKPSFWKRIYSTISLLAIIILILLIAYILIRTWPKS